MLSYGKRDNTRHVISKFHKIAYWEHADLDDHGLDHAGPVRSIDQHSEASPLDLSLTSKSECPLTLTLLWAGCSISKTDTIKSKILPWQWQRRRIGP